LPILTERPKPLGLNKNNCHGKGSLHIANGASMKKKQNPCLSRSGLIALMEADKTEEKEAIK
jgi:hypothetical protein